MGAAHLLLRVVLSCGRATRIFSEIAICVKCTRRSSPWLFSNIVIDLHSGVKVHRRLMASVLCTFKERDPGINLPKQLGSFNVLWKMEARG